MGEKWWEYWKYNFKQGRVSVREWMGKREKILNSIISLVAGLIVAILVTDDKILGAIIFAVTSALAYLLIFVILILIFTVFDVPFQTIKKQDEMIADLQAVPDVVIYSLTELREEGVRIRKGGESLASKERIEPWWQEFEEWKTKTVSKIALLDKSAANNWKTLGQFPHTRKSFPALSEQHRKYVEMCDDWLKRLDDVIAELRYCKMGWLPLVSTTATYYKNPDWDNRAST